MHRRQFDLGGQAHAVALTKRQQWTSWVGADNALHVSFYFQELAEQGLRKIAPSGESVAHHRTEQCIVDRPAPVTGAVTFD